jgi:serine/threonine protein kinase
VHHNGIIHRDIKPANLLWTADRRTVKIADFGVSHFSYAQALAATRARAANHALAAAASSHTHAPVAFKARAGAPAQNGAPGPVLDARRLRDPRDVILLDESDLSKTACPPTFMAPEVVVDLTTTVDPTTPRSARSRATSAASSSSHSAFDTTHTQTHVHAHDYGQQQQQQQQHPNGAGGGGGSGRAPRRAVTKAIDVWALGVTLYALLFGAPPFLPQPGGNEYALYRLICHDAWSAPDAMGLDRVRTGWVGGRRPAGPAPPPPQLGRSKGKNRGREESSSSEGDVVMYLLDRLLEKDAEKRITLDEVKVSVSPPSCHQNDAERRPFSSATPGSSATSRTRSSGSR